MDKILLIIFTVFFVASCSSEADLIQLKDTYPNGNPKREFIYRHKDDSLNFTIKEYYPNGRPSFSATVENGMFLGKKISYYKNGNLKEVDSLNHPCKLDYCCCDGIVTKYKPNGQLDHSFEIRDGAANGLVTLYDDSTGKVDIIYTYENDRKNGSYTSFYPSGKVYSKGTHRNDSLVDYQYFFKENGDTLKFHYTFNGKMDFPYKKWLDNGQVLTGRYSHDYDEVTYIWYSKDGNEIKRQVVKSRNKNWAIPD
jgi:antitoxin component YwqK of YwqJK toxin-antitoxin module